MIGSDILILALGLGLLALAFLTGRTAVEAGVKADGRRTLLAGVGAVVLALAGFLAAAEGVIRLL